MLDLATLLGLGLALGAILGSVIIEGGHLGALVNIPAAVIVFGGTFGATIICNRLDDILKLATIRSRPPRRWWNWRPWPAVTAF